MCDTPLKTLILEIPQIVLTNFNENIPDEPFTLHSQHCCNKFSFFMFYLRKIIFPMKNAHVRQKHYGNDDIIKIVQFHVRDESEEVEE